MTYFLYRLHPVTLPTSPILLAFLAIVLIVVPFLMAYRQYAGNWRMGSFLLRRSAKAKFDKLKTYESIYFWENAPKELGGDRADFKISAPMMVVPQFRGLFSIMEAFFEK